jgi:ElaB/YqjD/DUF883 family membrane-anchored ribosome-binding protein
MVNEKTDRMIDAGVASAEQVKLQAAEALEEAARRLRSMDVSAKGDDVRRAIEDAEDRLARFKASVGAEYAMIDAAFHERVEPVETIIADHPLPAVLVAAGVGALIGMLITKARD